MLTDDDLQEVINLSEIATLAPWRWEKRKHSIRLFTPLNGSCTVMDFVRMGMHGAQPRFSDRGNQPLGGVMMDGKDVDLDNHPDARLIIVARNAIADIAVELLAARRIIVADQDRYERIKTDLLVCKKQLERADRWIPVKEKLPANYHTVMAYKKFPSGKEWIRYQSEYTGKKWTFGDECDDEWRDWPGDGPSHWRELLAPPDEEEAKHD